MKALLFLIALACASHSATLPPWKEILGPSEGKPPVSDQGPVVWRNDLAKAMAEARQANRPLFITFRCLPCEQCDIHRRYSYCHEISCS